VSEVYSGRQFVGMDLHRRRSVLVRMTESRGASGDGADPQRPGQLGHNEAGVRTPRTAFALVTAEPMTGIEPAYSAWESDVGAGGLGLTCGDGGVPEGLG
jgi:hypothetical protein